MQNELDFKSWHELNRKLSTAPHMAKFHKG